MSASRPRMYCTCASRALQRLAQVLSAQDVSRVQIRELHEPRADGRVGVTRSVRDQPRRRRALVLLFDDDNAARFASQTACAC